jgi:hypothetical protein
MAYRWGAAVGLQNRTITADLLASIKTYNAQFINHLYNNGIAEAYRAQFAQTFIGSSVTQAEANFVTQQAEQYGVPPTIILDMVYSASPITNGDFQQQIQQLQEVGGLDQAYALNNEALQSATYNGNGICGYPGDLSALQHSADFAAYFGTFLVTVAAPLSGPAAPAVTLLGTAELGGGALF